MCSSCPEAARMPGPPRAGLNSAPKLLACIAVQQGSGGQGWVQAEPSEDPRGSLLLVGISGPFVV